MPERIAPGPVSGMRDNCEAVCIHTRKIFDSCREQDTAPYRLCLIKNQWGLRMTSSSKAAGLDFFSLR